jgi:hypothetical protein
VDGTSETLDGCDSVPGTFLDSWADNHTTVHLHLFGWRRNAKRPGVDVCAAFEYDPERSMPTKSEFIGEIGTMNRARHGLYEVQSLVFVDVVKPADFFESVTELPDSRLPVPLFRAPAVIWLHPLNRCPLLPGETPDVAPLIGGEVVLFGIESFLSKDGERRVSNDFVGDFSSVSSHVKLHDEVVESTSQVVEAVAHDERRVGVNRLQLAYVKTICESVVVTIHSNGVSAKIDTTVEVLQDAVVLSGAVHLGYGTFEASETHV